MTAAKRVPSIDTFYSSRNGYVPENELMRAIILRVIEDLKKGGELKEDAISFLNSDEDEYVFSFISICNYLGFNPSATRNSILYSIETGRRISTRRRAA